MKDREGSHYVRNRVSIEYSNHIKGNVLRFHITKIYRDNHGVLKFMTLQAWIKIMYFVKEI